MGTKAPLGVGTAALLFSLLAGCAGSDTHLRLLEKDGAARIEPVTGHFHDYLVRLTSAIDFGYDSSKKEVRDDTALRMIRPQCPAARIVGEETIQKPGTGPDYIIQIRCDGAEEAAPSAVPKGRKPINRLR